MSAGYSHHSRSASFPLKSNPIMPKIEQELNKLRKSEASSTSPMETITIGLSGLAELYKCINDAISSPLTQPPPSLHRHLNAAAAKRLLDGCSKLLETSNQSRHLLASLNQAIADLRSNLIARNPNSSTYYFSSRKATIRSSKELIVVLIHLDEGFGEFTGDATEVIRVLGCVSIINISVIESLLHFLAAPLSSPKSKKFWVSRLLKKCKTNGNNDLSDVDSMLHDLFLSKVEDGEKYSVAEKRLEALEVGLRGIENELIKISKQLTRTRTSLVNLISF